MRSKRRVKKENEWSPKLHQDGNSEIQMGGNFVLPTIKKGKKHKQPRNLLRTIAKGIGNTTSQPNLFTMPSQFTINGVAFNNGELYTKEKINKGSVVLALHLIELFQTERLYKDIDTGHQCLEITNLAPLTEKLNCNNHRIKEYFFYLGGYMYPLVDNDPKTGGIRIKNEHLFKIEFIYPTKLNNKYIIKDGVIQGVKRFGHDLLSFIVDEPVAMIRVIPNVKLIAALKSKCPGYILAENNDFVELNRKLESLIAIKILNYSSGHGKNWVRNENTLFEELGLEEDVKRQGRPRIRDRVMKAFAELKEIGHILEYQYDDQDGMYRYTCSNKFVQHQEEKKSKKDDQQGVQKYE